MGIARWRAVELGGPWAQTRVRLRVCRFLVLPTRLWLALIVVVAFETRDHLPQADKFVKVDTAEAVEHTANGAAICLGHVLITEHRQHLRPGQPPIPVLVIVLKPPAHRFRQ